MKKNRRYRERVKIRKLDKFGDTSEPVNNDSEVVQINNKRYRERKHSREVGSSSNEFTMRLARSERNRRYRERVKIRKLENLGETSERVNNYSEVVQITNDSAVVEVNNDSEVIQVNNDNEVVLIEVPSSLDVCTNFWSVRENIIRPQERRFNLDVHFKEYMNKKIFSDKLDDYCRVCDRIWWTTRLRHLRFDTPIYDFVKSLNYYDMQEPFMVCFNFCTFLQRKKIPSLATLNGYFYPEIPKDLPDLCPLSERLISPRIPFMQIVILDILLVLDV